VSDWSDNDITEILLKVVLNTKTLTLTQDNTQNMLGVYYLEIAILCIFNLSRDLTLSQSAIFLSEMMTGDFTDVTEM
jgi:hypothetical protein